MMTPQTRRDLAVILSWLLAWATPAIEIAALITWSVPLAATGAATAMLSGTLWRAGQ